MLFFSEETTLKEKIARSLIMLVTGFTALGATGQLFFYILINDNVISNLIVPSIIASVLIIIFLIRAVLDETSVVRKYSNKSGQRPIKFILIMCVIIPILLSMFMLSAIPSTLHMLFSEPGDLVVTIKHKSPGYLSQAGNGGISIKEHKYIINDHVYNISENDWDSLAVGDKIRLFGKKSYWGFSYDRYEILTKNCKGSDCISSPSAITGEMSSDISWALTIIFLTSLLIIILLGLHKNKQS